MQTKKIVNQLFLSLLITCLIVYYVNVVYSATVYTSSLQFNNTKDKNNKVISDIQFYLVNVTEGKTYGPYTCNSTGGFKFASGIGNGTTYRIDFYMHDVKVYQSTNFVTNATNGTSNTVGPFTIPRLAYAVNGSSVSVFLANTTGVEFISESMSVLEKILRVTVNATGVSIIKVFHGTDLTMPSKVLVGGRDITAYKVASEDLLGNYQDCWFYNATSRVIVIKGTHSSPLTYEVQFAPTSVPWIPQIPSEIVIFDVSVPTLLLILALLLVVAGAVGAYLIIAASKK